jgi:hypothetical protein
MCSVAQTSLQDKEGWIWWVVEGEWSASHPGHFNPEESNPFTHLSRSERYGEVIILDSAGTLSNPTAILTFPGAAKKNWTKRLQ